MQIIILGSMFNVTGTLVNISVALLFGQRVTGCSVARLSGNFSAG
jgi:hypothetical protein